MTMALTIHLNLRSHVGKLKCSLSLPSVFTPPPDTLTIQGGVFEYGHSHLNMDTNTLTYVYRLQEPERLFTEQDKLIAKAMMLTLFETLNQRADVVK